MIRKLAAGFLIGFAAFAFAVASNLGYEWWQNRNPVSRVVVAPSTQVVAPTTTASALVAAPLEIAEVAPQAKVDARREAERASTTTTLHPQVQAQGLGADRCNRRGPLRCLAVDRSGARRCPNQLLRGFAA